MKLFTLEFATSSSRTAVRCGSRAVIEANLTLNLNPSLRDADVRGANVRSLSWSTERRSARLRRGRVKADVSCPSSVQRGQSRRQEQVRAVRQAGRQYTS